MIDDIDINKASIIRRCLARINEEYRGTPNPLENFTVQDSIILNILRACEAAIDLAMHRIAKGSLGIPQTSREAFDLLLKDSLISPSTATSMKNMVGFRNIAVHSYQSIQLPILEAILETHLSDFEKLLSDLSL